MELLFEVMDADGTHDCNGHLSHFKKIDRPIRRTVNDSGAVRSAPKSLWLD